MNVEPPPLPLDVARPPKVIFWFKAYCVFSSLVHGFLTYQFLCLATELNREPHAGLGLSGVLGMVATVLCLFCGGLFVAWVLPLISWPQPWTWAYGSVILSVTTLVVFPLFPLSLPLLIFWQKAEAKNYLVGRLPDGVAPS